MRNEHNTRFDLDIDLMDEKKRKALLGKFTEGTKTSTSSKDDMNAPTKPTLVIGKHAHAEERLRAEARRRKANEGDTTRYHREQGERGEQNGSTGRDRRNDAREQERREGRKGSAGHYGGSVGGAGGGGGTTTKKRLPKKERTGFEKFLAKIRIYLDGVLGGVTDVSGRMLRRRFLFVLSSAHIPLITEGVSLVGAILYPVSKGEERIAAQQKQLNNLFAGTYNLELLERFYQIYNEKVLTELVREYREVGRDARVLIEEKTYELKELYRAIYILRNNVGSITKAIEDALVVHKEFERFDDVIMKDRFTLIRKAIDMLFYELTPKLLLLMRIIAKDDLDPDTEEMHAFLAITEHDEIGYYTKEKAKLEKMLAGKKKASGEKKERVIPPYTQKGLDLIATIVTYDKDARGSNDEFHPLFRLDVRDKVYRIRTLLDVFDNEYYVVLSTSKVKFRTVYDTATETDYTREFELRLADENDLKKRIDEYIAVINEMAELDDETDYSKKLRRTKEISRSKFGKLVQVRAFSFFNNLKEVLETFLRNKKTLEHVLLNQNDRLFFDIGIYGKKRVNNYTVLQALTETYFFILGAIHLLSEGELAGAGHLVEEEDAATPDENEGEDDADATPFTATPASLMHDDADESASPQERDENEAPVDGDAAFASADDADEAEGNRDDLPGNNAATDDDDALARVTRLFREGDVTRARKEALSLLAHEDRASSRGKRVLALLLTSFMDEKAYDRVILHYDNFPDVAKNAPEVEGIYKKAQEGKRDQEKETYVVAITDIIRSIELGLRELIMYILHKNDDNILLLLKEKIASMEKKGVNEKVVEKWKTLYAKGKKGGLPAPLVSYSDFFELIQITAWIKKNIIARAVKKEQGQLTEAVSALSTTLTKTVLNHRNDAAHHRLHHYDTKRLNIILVDCQKCDELVKDVMRRAGYFSTSGNF